ncbi:hepatic lectin-like [Periophthalmus magnuspinnatus]|uniref:hepatic lectin-like n=1 Tax=Periophthalmus magnuspinnatus TaxID=409849 RepID=UPI0024368A2B|nr:hepatic lectin-like [Periophthalmus magnuspinnatus]
MAKMTEENVYANVAMIGQNQGMEPVLGSQRRSKVTVERVALVVLSVLLLAAVAALTGVSAKCSCEDKTKAMEKNTTVPGPTCPNHVAPCGKDWELHGTKCYYFSPHSAKLPWNESRVMCQWLNGDLVTIESREEQVFLDAKLQTLMSDHFDKFWIGLTDSESEGRWMWTDGSPLNQSLAFWVDDDKNKEPDNWTEEDPDGEDCVRMGRSAFMGELSCWYDRSCKKKHRSICEKRAHF